jgi:hypothetical protein
MQAGALQSMLAGGQNGVDGTPLDELKRFLGYLNDASSDAAGFAEQAADDAKRHRVPADGDMDQVCFG